jgi:hypothetical protein
MAKTTYTVRACYVGIPVFEELADVYGPFSDEEMAEQCVIALAGRNDVRSATIHEQEGTN